MDTTRAKDARDAREVDAKPNVPAYDPYFNRQKPFDDMLFSVAAVKRGE